MNTVRIGAAAAAALSVAGLLAGCGKDSAQDDSPVAFVPVTGDQYTANPGAFQTDGVVVPPQHVVMVGDPVAAQAAVNAGLPQGTITSTVGDTTVYYPPVPAIPGVAVARQVDPPAPMARPANTRPWQYTPAQIDIFRGICETGRWGSWVAGVDIQTQTCWSLYGRRLGVRPWTPDQPRPWLRHGYPRPWFDPAFRADVPVMWVYPRDWTRPRPQPVISVSITLNIGSNPYRRVNPRYTEPFYPVWAVTPGRVVEVRDQARIVAPVYTSTTTTTTTTTVTAPVAPGVVLAPLPTSAKVAPVLALPGQAVAGNVNTDASLLVPAPAALQGATVQAGSRASLEAAVGTSVSVTVPTSTTAPAARTGARTSDAATSDAPTSAAATGAPTGARISGAPAGTSTSPAPVPPSGAAESPSTGTSTPGETPAPRTTVAPETTVAPAPTTVAPPAVTSVLPPATTQPPVVTPAPTTQAPVVTQAPTTQAPVVTQAPTTKAPVVTQAPTTTVAPKPVLTLPKPVLTFPKPTKAAPATTTTPPPTEG